MALNNNLFLQLNLPYGLQRNDQGKILTESINPFYRKDLRQMHQ